MSSFGSKTAGMETPAPLVNGIVNNASFHSNPHISQTLHQIIHILHFCPIDSMLNYAPDFVVNWIKVRAVWRPKILKFIGVMHDRLDYSTFGLEAANDHDALHRWFCKHTMSKRSQPK